MTTPDAAKPYSKHVPLELIDDPALPARENIDDDKLAELAASIVSLGLLQPIGLVPVGDRYQVVYGHRRTMACRSVEFTPVPAVIFPAGYTQLEAAKLHENIRREELNAGEEAVYFAQLYEAMATPDTDELARQLDVSRDYVERRLLLLRGDDDVLRALKGNAIPFGVAQELNKVKEANARADFLKYAILQGASERVVRNWRNQHDIMRELNPLEVIERVAGDTTAPAPVRNPLACLLCDSADEPHLMIVVQIHKHCLRFLDQQTGISIVGIFKERTTDAPAAPTGDGDAR